MGLSLTSIIHDCCWRRRGVHASGISQYIGGIMLLSALGMFAPLTTRAQNPRGSLRGEVQDATGGRIAGAAVVAKSTGWGIQSESVTNNRGEFRIEGLLPGAYQLTVGASGFNEASTTVEVAVSTARDVTVVLSPG